MIPSYISSHLPVTTLFPYTTLFRSHQISRATELALALSQFGAHPAQACLVLVQRIGCLAQPARVIRLACTAFRHVGGDRKSTRLNSSHPSISYAVFCLKKKIPNTFV